MAFEHAYWMLFFYVPNVHACVFTATDYEVLIHTAETRIIHELVLHVALILAHEHTVLEVPQVKTLSKEIRKIKNKTDLTVNNQLRSTAYLRGYTY
jgi:hypothetical protein